MTGSTFASLIRKFTRTNSTTLTNAEIVVFANAIKDELAEGIVANVDEGYFDMEMTRDLEANIRDYTFDNTVLKHVKYVTAKLDGTNAKPLKETDYGKIESSNLALMENSVIKTHYTGREPEFLITGRGLTILSDDDIDAVEEGLKVVAEVYPEDIDADDLASSTDLSVPSADDQHAMPRASHLVWARKVSIMYKEAQEKPIPLSENEKKVALSVEDMYKNLRKRNVVRAVKATVPQDDGQNY